MNYKELKGYLIAIDLDGTLIDENLKIDIESVNVLKELSVNNKVVIATGRPYRSSKKYYDLLGLDTPIINYNGAYIHSPKDKNFEEVLVTIKKDDLIRLMDDNKESIYNVFTEIRDDVYLIKEDRIVERFLDREGAIIKTGNFKDTLKIDSNGALIFARENTEKNFKDYTLKNFDYLLTRPWKFNDTLIIELYNKNVSKAKAINIIASYYNIDMKKTIAFGDSLNDIEMLNEVGYGVAMDGGNKELFENSSFKTKSVKESGIKYFFTHTSF